MSLEETINSDLKSAMLNKDNSALRSLRAIKQAILLAKTSGGSNISSDDEDTAGNEVGAVLKT